MISALQIKRFWMAFRPAWESYAGRKGVDPADRGASEAWRHAILAEECDGQSSLKTLSQGDYDKIMLRLAIETGREGATEYWAWSEERRCCFLIRQKLDKLSDADPPNHYRDAYALAIVRQAKLARQPERLEDLPAVYLRKILIALDRRLYAIRRRRSGGRRPARRRRDDFSHLEEAPF